MKALGLACLCLAAATSAAALLDRHLLQLPPLDLPAAPPVVDPWTAAAGGANATQPQADAPGVLASSPAAELQVAMQPGPPAQAASLPLLFPDEQQQQLAPPSGVQSEELPPEVAGLYDGTGPAAGPQTSDQAAPPLPKIGTLTSLLVPPPGAIPPALSAAQQAAVPMLAKLRQGTATVVYQRAVSNYDGTTMNCGLGYLNDYFKDNFVGVPEALYRGGELCGLCVRMWCVDTVCVDPLLRNGTFLVADSCKDCRGNELVVSARGMQNLTGVDYNVNPSVQVAWEWASCAPLVEGGIKMLPSDNNSPVFLGLNFSNLKTLIKAVRINGLDMIRTSYGFWTIDTPGKAIPLRPPYTLDLLGTNNQRLTKRLTSLTSQDLAINFGN